MAPSLRRFVYAQHGLPALTIESSLVFKLPITQVWFACALATVGVALVSLGGVIPPGADIVKYIAGEPSDPEALGVCREITSILESRTPPARQCL